MHANPRCVASARTLICVARSEHAPTPIADTPIPLFTILYKFTFVLAHSTLAVLPVEEMESQMEHMGARSSPDHINNSTILLEKNKRLW